MRKGFVVLMAACVLAISTVAFAAPQPLTNADLAQVSAGAGILDWFLGTGTGNPASGLTSPTGTAIADGEQAVAVDGDGSANAAAGALADQAAQAVNGEANTTEQNPTDSAVSSTGGLSANSQDDGLALAAAENSLAAYSDNPEDSAVAAGVGNEAQNFSDNGDVANATDNALAIADATGAANAFGENSQAFDGNDDVAVASNGVAIGNADGAATNIGDGNIAIDDPNNVILAQDQGVAVQNEGELAWTESGIAVANPSDVAISTGSGVAAEDSYFAVASENGAAANDNDDSAVAAGTGNIAIDDPSDAVVNTGSGIAAEDSDLAIASDNGIALEDNDDAANAVGTGNTALNASDNTESTIALGGGNAANANGNAQAAAGDGNKQQYQDADNAIAAMDNATVTVAENEIENSTIEDGSAAVVGNGNQVSTLYDDTDISVETDGGELEVEGVIAKEAVITDSFNTKEVEIDVTVTINDSFNVTTNAMEISGQNGVSAIVLANSLGEQYIGTNLNVTSAASTVPSVSAPGVPAATIGAATATTTLNQIVVNGSEDITVTF